jgi:hypothetical protein
VEAWKYLGELRIDKLTELMQKIWNEEEMMFKTVVITGA